MMMTINKRSTALGLIILLLPAAMTLAAQMNETVLVTFTGGSTGFLPYAGLAMDKDGNLYGTASQGGGGNILCTFSLGTPGCGVVFKVSPAGKETIIHSFAGGADGQMLFYGTSVTLDANGNIYGATNSGGVAGGGVVYKIDNSGKETILYSFPAYCCHGNSAAAGSSPNGALLLDAAGNIYGTAQYGGLLNSGCGSAGCGVVFKLDSAGNETVLYSFQGGAVGDGSGPNAGLIMDSAGNLYGTTSSGGANYQGIVFKVNPSGAENVLYSFAGGTDASSPNGGLVEDAAGNLYGTSSGGGAFGSGTVFVVSPTGREKVIYSFTGGEDGGYPISSLIRDAAGNLYGTTLGGGINGTVFKLDRTGNETVLYNFPSAAQGAVPVGNLVRDKFGNLYGVTNIGGRQPCGYGYPGCGVVFKLSSQ